MKRYLIILISFFITAAIHAQKNFQGEITYRLHANVETKPDAELKILFGDNKLKLRFKDKEEYDKEYLLVLFDSAAVFIINQESKTFSKTFLNSTPVKQFQKRSFSGYAATPVSQENNGLSSLLGGMSGSSNIVFYLADSLYYHIPPAFANNKELIVVQKNKIVLGAEISIKSEYNEMPDDTVRPGNLITVEAIEVRPTTINEDEFRIPTDYINRENISYEPVADTAVLMGIDTVVVSPPTQKKASKQPAKPNKPKSSQKSSAIKRKE
ncbi:MAG TPA: hypothetical protein VK484_02865 [Ferruginibacter sp.]|nr:hypothetical protein [Ferruginibacter sp.]